MTEITEFIVGPVSYDNGFIEALGNGFPITIAEVIGNDFKESEIIGKFIADAINEKIEKEKLPYLFKMCHNHQPECFSGICPNCNTNITQS